MATRNDVSVFWNLSPRLIVIAQPSTDITLQDLHDTLRDIEDEPANLAYPTLISSAGKEDLGGGVYVGITSTLQNAQIVFERRTNLLSSGTITTNSTPSDRQVLLIDSGATFIADGVKRSDWVVNRSDNSYSEVLRVDSETQLTVLKPTNGSSNNFVIGDNYEVYEMVQCSVLGGNLVAVDVLDTVIDPIFPTIGTQIVRTSSSSATLQELADIQYASFGNSITVDLTSPYSGVGYPNGTPRQPVNNLTDAVAIAVERGFTTLSIIGDLNVDSVTPSLRGYSLIGESANKTYLQVDADADVVNSEFSHATINGILDGGNVVADCVIETLNFVDGFIQQCVLNGAITLSTQDDAHFLDCWSGVPGLSTPTIDFGGSGSGLALRNYNGGITLTNKSGPESVSIDLNSGQIVLDNTVTAGTIVLRGIGTWTNELTYTGGANVVNQLITPRDAQASAFYKGVTIDPTSSYSGTTYPIGTDRMPVNNLADAKLIAADQGFNTFYIIGSMFFTPADNLDNYVIIGENASKSFISVDALTGADNTEFRECTLTGSLGAGSRNIVRESILHNLAGFDGIADNCMLLSTTTLQVDPAARSAFLSCYSGNPGDPLPVINFGGDGASLIVRGWSGGLRLENKTGLAASSLDVQGVIQIDDTVDAGEIHLRGIGHWEGKDSYAGSATIIDQLLSDDSVVQHMNDTTYDGVTFEDTMKDLISMAKGKIIENPAGTFTFYEQDNSTPRFVLVKVGNQRLRS